MQCANSPLPARGERPSEARVRGRFSESEHPESSHSLAEAPPHPILLPARGEKEAKRPPQHSHRDIPIIDQIVERLLHIHAWLDHTGLLQRETRLQDRVALLRPDLVEDKFGAFLELNVDDL